ncbi:DUF6328 family protein [Amycolatopsis samaneae]|uniref:DUF6328 family protein n=1 Tax=Amycolatopsis samaneae TaxID=664691 RepID=A0ABW5GML3_9PSEU
MSQGTYLDRPQRVEQPDAHDQWNFVARRETPAQRLDRDYAEIPREMSVAQTGVRLLLAFLLTVAFTPRFATLSEFERRVYVGALVLGVRRRRSAVPARAGSLRCSAVLARWLPAVGGQALSRVDKWR